MWWGATQSITLPSGQTVTIRGADLLTLGANGVMPGTILATVQRYAAGDLPNEITPEMFSQMGEVLNAYCLACVVDPPVSRDGANGTVPLASIPMQDKLHLFNLVVGAVPSSGPVGEEATAAARFQQGSGPPARP